MYMHHIKYICENNSINNIIYIHDTGKRNILYKKNYSMTIIGLVVRNFFFIFYKFIEHNLISAYVNFNTFI